MANNNIPPTNIIQLLTVAEQKELFDHNLKASFRYTVKIFVLVCLFICVILYLGLVY